MIHYKYLHANLSLVPIIDEDKQDVLKWRNEQFYHLRQMKKLTIRNQDNNYINGLVNLFDKEYPNRISFSYFDVNNHDFSNVA